VITTHSISPDEVVKQAEEAAYAFRGRYHLGDRGIHDFFGFLESTGEYLLFRYPFGPEKMEGFASLFHGEKLIVTNSSKTLGREYFTLAHELGHHIFDIEVDNQPFVHDKNASIGTFTSSNIPEYRVDWFAAVLLMPQQGVSATFNSLKKVCSDNFQLAFLLQKEFSVSFKAMIRRLRDLALISQAEYGRLDHYYDSTSLNLHNLAKAVGVEISLLDPTQERHIPLRYLDRLRYNLDSGAIGTETANQLLGLIGQTVADIGYEEREHVDDTEDDIFNKALESLTHAQADGS